MPENFKVFLEALPIIGISLVGIFAVTAIIILVVYLLNKGADWLEARRTASEDSEQ